MIDRVKELFTKLVSPVEADREQVRLAKSYQERLEARVRMENLRIRAGLPPTTIRKEK